MARWLTRQISQGLIARCREGSLCTLLQDDSAVDGSPVWTGDREAAMGRVGPPWQERAPNDAVSRVARRGVRGFGAMRRVGERARGNKTEACNGRHTLDGGPYTDHAPRGAAEGH